MTMTKKVRGRAIRMGWKKAKSGDKFQAIIEFPDGPPMWPLSVVWEGWPVWMVIEPPGDAAAEKARADDKAAFTSGER